MAGPWARDAWTACEGRHETGAAIRVPGAVTGKSNRRLRGSVPSCKLVGDVTACRTAGLKISEQHSYAFPAATGIRYFDQRMWDMRCLHEGYGIQG